MNQRTSAPILELALLVLLSALWGSSFMLIKIAVTTVPPATMVCARLAIGAALLLLLVWTRGLAMPREPALWGALLVQGLLQSALPFTLISWGEQHIDSGLAGLLTSTPPLFTFLITFCLLREGGDGLRKAFGVTLGLSGVLVVLGPDVLSSAPASVLGQIAVTGASVSYAVAAVYARRFAKQPALVTAACSMSIATLLMLPVAVLTDRPWTLSPTPAALWSVLALGVFATAFAMIIYFRLVRTLGSLGVTSGSYLRAGFSVALGVVFLDEALSASLVAGLILILCGVAVVNGQLRWPRRRRQAA